MVCCPNWIYPLLSLPFPSIHSLSFPRIQLGNLGSAVSSPSVVRGGAPAANAFRRIYGSQNATRGISHSFICNANDCVLITRIRCSTDSHVTSISGGGGEVEPVNPSSPLNFGSGVLCCPEVFSRSSESLYGTARTAYILERS